MKVDGMSIQDIMNMNPVELSRLSTRELKQVTSRLISSANKRIRRLGKSDIGQSSPAYIQAQKEFGGHFSLKSENIEGASPKQVHNRVLELHAQVRDYLSKKTSSVSGWKDVRKDVNERLTGKSSEMALNTKYKEKRFWKAYRKLEEQSQGGILNSKSNPNSKRNSDRIQKMLYNRIKDKGWNRNFDDIIDDITKKGGDIDKAYEYEQKRINQMMEWEEDIEESDDLPF